MECLQAPPRPTRFAHGVTLFARRIFFSDLAGSLFAGYISRCFKRKETKIWIWVDILMKFTFLLFSKLWRHRSRDQNGPNFNICSKSLLEPYSKNIVKRSCSLINSVLENGHDYFFLEKCGSRKSNWKVCQLSAQQPFELATKENFAKGLSVSP